MLHAIISIDRPSGPIEEFIPIDSEILEQKYSNNIIHYIREQASPQFEWTYITSVETREMVENFKKLYMHQSHVNALLNSAYEARQQVDHYILGYSDISDEPTEEQQCCNTHAMNYDKRKFELSLLIDKRNVISESIDILERNSPTPEIGSFW